MENLIVGLIVCAAAGFTLYRMICKPRSGCGCGCDCGNTAGGSKGKGCDSASGASCRGAQGSCNCGK